MNMPLDDVRGTGRPPGLSKRFAGVARSDRRGQAHTRPFSIRLTDVERAALKAAAGTRPISEFARERLLDAAARRRHSRRPLADTALLGQILARLGKSGLTSSLADLGLAARLGTVVIAPEMEQQLQAVCADIQEVKRMLIRGLGLEGRSR